MGGDGSDVSCGVGGAAVARLVSAWAFVDSSGVCIESNRRNVHWKNF